MECILSFFAINVQFIKDKREVDNFINNKKHLNSFDN